MTRVLVVATSRKTRGGITSVVKAHETGEQWKEYNCRWIETHRDGSGGVKVLYFLRSFFCYLFLLPRYDLVHIHFSTQKSAIRKLPFMWWAKVWRKKTISHLHACDLETSLHSRFQWVYRYLLNSSDCIITLSDYWRKEVLYFCTTAKKVRRGHVVVVFNPCTTHVDATEPLSGFCDSHAPLQRKHSILFAGTLIARKGYADLLRAFALIAPRHTDWQLMMAGNGEMEKGQQLARELGIEQQTLWLGWVSGADKERAFREADIFCLPSYAEGFPMAVLDAMAYSLPVVTTPVGGIPDIAIDGENMLLFTPGNLQQLADRLEQLINEDGLRDKLAQASHQLAATTFNVKTIDKQIGKLYAAVLSTTEKELPPPSNRPTILINAYACSPDMGSEPGMAWNWCVNLAKHCELHIITEGEFREKIEHVTSTLQQGSNMHFYYNPVPEKVRRMCWNQGDWRFYHYYKKWQKKTAEMAREICQQEKIDILHQLNMIGFREPGYLWKVSRETGIPFVWGPIGGLKQFPMAYVGGSLKMRVFQLLKNFLNVWQLKYDRRVDAAMQQASLLVSSIPDSYRSIKRYKGKESVIIPETGTFVREYVPDDVNRFQKPYLTILWVGKFDFRKRLDLAIAIVALATTANARVLLKVLGTGSAEQQRKVEDLVKRMGVEDMVQWMGSCSNEQVQKEMRKADLFLFTSVNEDTSTVVLEAVSNYLPVLCFDACGMSAVINETVGEKIPLTNPEQSVRDFAEKIEYLYHHREVLAEMSANCKKRAEELSWDNKAKEMVKLYEDMLTKEMRR